MGKGRFLRKSVSSCACKIALTISVLLKNHPLVVFLAVGLISLTAENWMQHMGEMNSFYTLGSSEDWISSEVRVRSSVSDAALLWFPSTNCGLVAPCLHK